MPRPANTQERRHQIALGLMDVMARTGYEAASVQEIAAAADLSPGLVHYHFQNKQEILLLLLDLLVQRQQGRLEARLHELRGIEALDAFIDAHLALGKDADPRALACWIALGGEALRQPAVGKAFGEALQGLQRKLLELLRDCGCPKPRVAAGALLSAIQGYYLVAATARDLIPRGSAAPAVRAMARALLAPAKASRRSHG